MTENDMTCCDLYGDPVRSSVSDDWVHPATPTGQLVCMRRSFSEVRVSNPESMNDLSAAVDVALRRSGDTISVQTWSLVVVKRADGYRALLTDCNGPSFSQTTESFGTVRGAVVCVLKQSLQPILGQIPGGDPDMVDRHG